MLVAAYYGTRYITFLYVLLIEIKIVSFDLDPISLLVGRNPSDFLKICFFTLGALSIVEIVTKLKNLVSENERLLEISQKETRAREDLMAILAHDLRNPLGAIQMQSELLKQKLKSIPEYEIIEKNISSIHLTEESSLLMVNNILEFSKFETGSIVLHKASLQ